MLLYQIYTRHSFTKYFSENSVGTSTITIRTGTENQETIAVRRKFIHPWYYQGGATYYNDIAVLELGNKRASGQDKWVQIQININNFHLFRKKDFV